jgi:hypothetical protein
MPDPSDFLMALVNQTGLNGKALNDATLDNQQIQQNRQQLQLGGMRIGALQQQQAQEESWQQDVQAYFNDPKPGALGNLILKYPGKADEIKQSKAVLDEPARQSQLTQFSSLHNAVENNRSDLARTLISNIHAAEKAKGIADPQVEDIIGQLDSKDPAVVAGAMKQIKGFTQINLAALDPKYAETLSKLQGEQDEYASTGDSAIYNKRTGQVVRQAPEKTQYRSVRNGDGSESIVALNPEGGGQASSGSAAGARGDVSRLINTDAGGGYVPDSVNTLGQFVGFGRSLNQRGAKSSSAGTYQINGTTMAEFAPKVFGPEWKSAPFDAQSQERIGESIFNWAKQQRDPAAALRGRWVSLDARTAARLVQGNWQQARGTIAQGETGGGPGASAASGMPKPVGANVVFQSQAGAAKPKPAPSGYQYRPDGMTLEAIPGGPADKGKTGGGKALSDGVIKRLEPKIDARDGLTSALRGFKDDFGGHNILGDTSNTIQGLTGMGAEGQRDWWAQFRSVDNVIRNQLFGASLTEGEKAAYNSTTVTPRMAPSEIRRNLKSRLDIVNKALARQRNILTKNGFSTDSIDALFDPMAAGGGSAVKPSAPGFKILGVRKKQ